MSMGLKWKHIFSSFFVHILFLKNRYYYAYVYVYEYVYYVLYKIIIFNFIYY